MSPKEKTDGCFLCSPSEDLVISRSCDLLLMAGLGPITERYMVLGTTRHSRSFADAYEQSPSIVDDITNLRAKLEAGRAPLLLTEHGRVPMCSDGESYHDMHCFHAHFLLFEGRSAVKPIAARYFLTKYEFGDLETALKMAATLDHYFLLSDNSHKYTIFSDPLNIQRQFFRMIVAHTEGQLELADWKHRPNHDVAIAIAANERERLEDCP